MIVAHLPNSRRLLTSSVRLCGLAAAGCWRKNLPSAASRQDLVPCRAMSSTNEAPPDNLVNFGCGHPDYALLPVEEIASATQQALLDDPNGRKWLQYGRENGNYPARAAIAEFLTNLYQTSHAIDPETLFVTSGVSHGIQLTCRTLDRVHRQQQQQQQDTNEAPLCWVEDPTYFLVPPIFEQAGYELEAVRTSPDNGLDLSDLETKIRAARTASPQRLLVLYCIPIHHNPLGVSLSDETRTQLIHLCNANQVYLIADEVYHGLGFPGTTSSPTAMAMRGSSPYIVSVSAFTKLLCPGIRCGWIQTSNRELLRQIGREGVLDSGGCSSQLSSGIVRQLIQNGKLDSYLAALQAEYAERCQHLCQLLQDVSEGSEYPFRFDFAVPQGGYFLWVRIIKGAPPHFAMDEAFRSFCQTKHDVDFKTGMSCSSYRIETSSNGNPFSQCFRLCFAYYDIPALTLGVQRLCKAIQEYSPPPSSL